jgi:hypothetical protein
MKKIGIELAKLAKEKGICDEWFVDLKKTEDIDKLLDMYLRGIDFCLSNEFPSNQFIKENFVGKMEAFGVHLDEDLKEKNTKKLVALGGCTGEVVYNGYSTGEIFLKHDSFLNLTALDNSFVMIDMFDKSTLTVIASDNSKVCINHYGGEFEIIKKGNAVVKIIEKHKKTY